MMNTKEGNELIAKFMGYIYKQENVYYEDDLLDSLKTIYSKVPIEVYPYVDENDKEDNYEYYFKPLPNPDFHNYNNPKWNPDIKELNWDTINFGNYITDLSYHKSWDQLIPVIDKIENLDVSEQHYKWEENGKTRSNFMCFEIDIKLNYCSIWMELQLDPPQLIAGGHNKKYPTRIDAAWNAVIEFIKYYNNEK